VLEAKSQKYVTTAKDSVMQTLPAILRTAVQQYNLLTPNKDIASKLV
jgi:hypothetical protein